MENKMLPPAPMDHEITQHYATAIDALCETAAAAYTLGRWGHALSLLRTTLQLLETHEATPWHRLKVLHLYGRVLVLDHFLAHEGADEMFAIIRSAKHLAEAIHDHQA